MTSRPLSSHDRVADIMTRAVVAVSGDAGVDEIVAALHGHRVTALPVLGGDGRVVGVVSEADVITAGLPGKRTRAELLTAGLLMTAPAVTVHPEALVSEAARTMVDGHVKRLPVVDAEGRLCGIVSRSDILELFLPGDDDLTRQVRFELLSLLTAQQVAGIDVAVAGGRVRLSGRIPADPEPEVLLRHCRRVTGVVDAEIVGVRTI